jgi:hypothetical protein
MSEHNSTPQVIESEAVDYKDINMDIENCIKNESGLMMLPMRFKMGQRRQIGMDLSGFPEREERPAIKVPTQHMPRPGVPDDMIL